MPLVGDFSIGDEVAGYRIEEQIARGGMGVVYRATHLGLERPVALKVIARELVDRRGFRERFLRESRLAARLDPPALSAPPSCPSPASPPASTTPRWFRSTTRARSTAS